MERGEDFPSHVGNGFLLTTTAPVDCLKIDTWPKTGYGEIDTFDQVSLAHSNMPELPEGCDFGGFH